MAPRDATLEAALKSSTKALFEGADRDALTVNAVRKAAEDRLDLDSGFFKSDKWKNRSKEIITSMVTELSEAQADTAPVQPKAEQEESKNGVKRESTEKGTPVKKRAKIERIDKAAKPVKKSESDSDEEKPAKKRKLGKKRRVADSDEEDDDGDDDFKDESSPDATKFKGESDSEDEKPRKKAKVESSDDEKSAQKKKLASAIKKDESDASSPLSELKEEDEEDKSLSDNDESELSEVLDEPPKRKKAKAAKSKAKKEGDSDSSLSSVLDEPPKRKGKSQAPAKASKAKAAGKASSELSPDEAEIKKLQGHLVKCGIRKIWAFELKEYGDNAKAKIRHLRGMLKDAGMDGRFSEAKAREIKERRELEADLEAVQEMNKNWGLDGGRRASRSRAKQSLKESSSDEQTNTDHEGDEPHLATEDEGFGAEHVAKSRGSARYKADLAFLGDDSESDSE